MTRINCVDVESLTDQHLFAEFRELPRIFGVARFLKPHEAVSTYRMGTGHMLFFYDRTLYLANRHKAIVRELRDRRYKLNLRPPLRPILGLDHDWSPTLTDKEVNLERLRQKLAQRPGWYRHRGQPVASDFYG